MVATVVNTLAECSSHLQRQSKLYLINIIGRCSHDTYWSAAQHIDILFISEVQLGLKNHLHGQYKTDIILLCRKQCSRKVLDPFPKYIGKKFLIQDLILKPCKLKGKKILLMKCATHRILKNYRQISNRAFIFRFTYDVQLMALENQQQAKAHLTHTHARHSHSYKEISLQ